MLLRFPVFIRKWALFVVLSIILAGVFGGMGPAAVSGQGEAKVLYVDAAAGNDSNDGTINSPYRTIQKALLAVQPGETIKLADGTYQEANETVRPGTPQAPIVIEPKDPGTRPVLDGKGNTLNAIRLVHSHYTVRGFEIRNTKEGIRIEGATAVVVENNLIHHVNKEGVRLRYFAGGNIVRNNTIWATGLAGNGEGIYIGTAPEQRAKNGGKPDTSTGNLIEGNELYQVTEGIDIKEDSSFNTVTGNVIHHNTDPNSGGINVRADENYIRGNLSYDNAGAGYRFGGDIVDSPLYGYNYHYGVKNVLRDNVARNNGGHGYKFMNGPQVAGYSNLGTGNGGVLYYYALGIAPFVSGNDPPPESVTPPPVTPDPLPAEPVAPPPESVAPPLVTPDPLPAEPVAPPPESVAPPPVTFDPPPAGPVGPPPEPVAPPIEPTVPPVLDEPPLAPVAPQPEELIAPPPSPFELSWAGPVWYTQDVPAPAPDPAMASGVAPLAGPETASDTATEPAPESPAPLSQSTSIPEPDDITGPVPAADMHLVTAPLPVSRNALAPPPVPEVASQMSGPEDVPANLLPPAGPLPPPARGFSPVIWAIAGLAGLGLGAGILFVR